MVRNYETSCTLQYISLSLPLPETKEDLSSCILKDQIKQTKLVLKKLPTQRKIYLCCSVKLRHNMLTSNS